MKNKRIIIYILSALLLTGCNIHNINSMTNDELVDVSLSEKTSPNTNLEGYNLYIPKGMVLSNDYKSNNMIYSDKDKYYLYVDLISYYNKVENEYKINSQNTAKYEKTINYNNKKGYILVTEYENKYFVEAMYNYAKIEVITKDLKKSLVNSLVILNNITYNDKVIESLIGTNKLTYDEEEFELLGPNNTKNESFLQYEEEFGNFIDKEHELPDEDKIEINNE